MARHSILIDIGAGVRIVGSRYSSDARRVCEFLARNRVPYQWLVVEADEEAAALLRALSIQAAETPVPIGGPEVLRNPSNAQLASLLGLGSGGAAPTLHDVLIVGGGPAGLAAAVYAASERLDTEVIDAVAFGGQAGTSSRIENYLGFPTGISCGELAERAALQARRFGARMVVPGQAVALHRDDGHYRIELADGSIVNAHTVIVATGGSLPKARPAGARALRGRGDLLRRHPCRGTPLCGDPVLIVGGGNSACQAALFLSE